MIYLEAFYMGITIFFASYKAKPKKTCRKPKPKMMKHQKNIVFVFCFFEILIDHIHSNKQKNTSFLFFHFKTKKPRENQKSNLLSQNQTLSHMFFLCFFGFARVLCFFWFVYCFTSLPSVSLCLRTLSVLGSQTLIKVSHSRACALCETRLGIGCAVMFMHLKISCCSAFLLYGLSLATSVPNLGILEPWIRTYTFLSRFDIFKQRI